MGRMLADAILQLPRICAQACPARDVMHYSTQEVADRLSISVAPCAFDLFRARRRPSRKTWSRVFGQSALVKANTLRRPPDRSTRSRDGRSLLALNAAIGFASGD